MAKITIAPLRGGEGVEGYAIYGESLKTRGEDCAERMIFAGRGMIGLYPLSTKLLVRNETGRAIRHFEKEDIDTARQVVNRTLDSYIARIRADYERSTGHNLHIERSSTPCQVDDLTGDDIQTSRH